MKEMTFEQAMKRLEEIVKQLEAGEAALDKSIALFEEGTKLSAYCNKLLDNAEQKVTIVLKGADGEAAEEPFNVQE